MTDDIPFDRKAPETGVCERVAPQIQRLVAANPGPFTFSGTCTYLLGDKEVALIDPGPDDEAHLTRILEALGTSRLAAILVTHTHRDHSPLAQRLKAVTGAPIYGCAPHFAARPLAEGEVNLLDASADQTYAPDHVLADGEGLTVGALRIEALATPGHTMNHLAFALPDRHILFSGDHVMAWSTSIVAPPDGAMGAYMASLARLIERDDALYFPGHGGPVREPRRFVSALLAHRRMREATILDAVRAGVGLIPDLVERLYRGLDPKLRGAAALSVFAHLEELGARGLIKTDQAIGLHARFTAV